MDILKKFRYNFHFWLKNCYQAAGDPKEEGKHDEPLGDMAMMHGQDATPAGKQNKKYMVLQMGQGNDHIQDQALINYLTQNALAIQHHPGAV